jgi:hypothetical protein
MNAHQLLQKEMYVSCITFTFTPEADTGRMAVVWWEASLACSHMDTHLPLSHDYIASMHAKSHGKMFQSFQEWMGKGWAGIVEYMVGYANYVDRQRKEESVPDVVPEPVIFEKGPGDLPLLPPEVKGVKGMEIAKSAQEVIRAYFLRHYRMSYFRSVKPIHLSSDRACHRW